VHAETTFKERSGEICEPLDALSEDPVRLGVEALNAAATREKNMTSKRNPMGMKALWISSGELLKAFGRNHWVAWTRRDERRMMKAVDACADALIFIVVPDVVEPKTWGCQQCVPFTNSTHTHHTIQRYRVSVSSNERRIKLKQTLEHVTLI
jgi:hypothetical protein